MSSLSSLIKSDYFEPRGEDVEAMLAKYQESYLETLALGEPGARSRVESSGDYSIDASHAGAGQQVLGLVNNQRVESCPLIQDRLN